MQLTNHKIFLKNQTKWKWNQNHWICHFLWLFSFIASRIVKEQRMDYQTVRFHLKNKKWKMKKHFRFTQKALFSFWPNNIHLTLCFICINIFDTNVWSNARLQIKSYYLLFQSSLWTGSSRDYPAWVALPIRPFHLSGLLEASCQRRKVPICRHTTWRNK